MACRQLLIRLKLRGTFGSSLDSQQIKPQNWLAFKLINPIILKIQRAYLLYPVALSPKRSAIILEGQEQMMPPYSLSFFHDVNVTLGSVFLLWL